MIDSMGSKMKDYGPFLLRVALGVMFVAKGVDDLRNLSGHPPFWSVVSAGVELVGGLLALIGLLTRWAAMGLAVVMFIGLVTECGSFRSIVDYRETHAWMFTYLMMSLALWCLGGGEWSVDLRNKRKTQET